MFWIIHEKIGNISYLLREKKVIRTLYLTALFYFHAFHCQQYWAWLDVRRQTNFPELGGVGVGGAVRRSRFNFWLCPYQCDFKKVTISYFSATEALGLFRNHKATVGLQIFFVDLPCVFKFFGANAKWLGCST